MSIYDEDDDGQIPELVLSYKGEKGWAQFRSTNDLTGKQLKALRKAAGSGERGDASNAFYEVGLGILVTSWEIPKAPDLGIPRGNASSIIDRVPAVVLRQLELHIHPYLDALLKREGVEADPMEPGSPTRPASD